MTHKEALQKALKAIDLLITADNMSSFETSILTDDMRLEVMKCQIAAQQSLEQSEPRRFSESIIDEAERYFHDKRMTIAKVDFLDYEDFISFIKHLSNRNIQSLSPKEGKEEVRTYTYRELEWFGVYLMSGDYIHTITNNKELVECCKKQAQAFTDLADYESLSQPIEPTKYEAMNNAYKELSVEVMAEK